MQKKLSWRDWMGTDIDDMIFGGIDPGPSER